MRFNTKKTNNVRFEDLNIHNHWYHSSYHRARCDTRDNVCLIYIYIYTLYLHPIYVMGISGDILKCIAVISFLLISIVLTVLLFSAQQQYHIKQIKTMSATKNPNPADSPLTISSVNTPPYRACKLKKTPIKKPSWSWSYGSWIYNYLCNQCISPLTL